jgi:hypothetical protein
MPRSKVSQTLNCWWRQVGSRFLIEDGRSKFYLQWLLYFVKVQKCKVNLEKGIFTLDICFLRGDSMFFHKVESFFTLNFSLRGEFFFIKVNFEGKTSYFCGGFAVHAPFSYHIDYCKVLYNFCHGCS